MYCEKHGETSVICRDCDLDSIEDNTKLQLVREKATDAYVQLNAELATLLGWMEVQQGGEDNGVKIPPTWLVGYEKNTDRALGRDVIPKWTHDFAAVFKLAFDMHIVFYRDLDETNAYYLDEETEQRHKQSEFIRQHESKYVATAVAIVKLAIKQLKQRQEKEIKNEP